MAISRAVQSIFAVATAALIGWGSIADNGAICPEPSSLAADTSGDRDAPAPLQQACDETPCRTPTQPASPLIVFAFAEPLVEPVDVSLPMLLGIDAPTPPTPPPTPPA
jgi:hypothetical protein